MDYLKILRENPDLADEFDSLFDFFLLDELSPRDDAEGRCTFSLPGMVFARDGSGGEYHLLEDGSIGYYSSEGEAGRLAESMDDLFSLLAVSYTHQMCIRDSHSRGYRRVVFFLLGVLLIVVSIWGFVLKLK